MNVPELSEPIPEPIISAGKILAEKRMEWEMTVQDVASHLNLGADTIEALEADDYDRLPGTTFVKGYIRSYAKLLKMDVENLMDNIGLQPERITEIPSTKASLKRKGKTRSRDRKSAGGGAFKWLFLLLVIGALITLSLTQLPKFGINNISDLLKIGSQQDESVENNQLIIPQDSNEGEQQGALIRIE